MFAQLSTSFSAVMLLFMLMAVGYILGHIGWITSSEKKFLGRFILNAALPFNCFRGILTNLTHDHLLESLRLLLCVVALNFVLLVLCWTVASVMKIPRRRKGVFVDMAFLANTLYIGLPMTQQLFGDAGIPSMMIFYLGTSVYVQSVSIMLIEYSGGESTEKFSVLGLLKKIFSKPPIIGLCAGYLCVIFNIHPPQLLMTFSNYMSQTVTPLALIYCGYIMYELGLKNLHMEEGYVTMLALRLIVCPFLCAVMCKIVGITGLTRSVFIMEAGLPVVTQIPVMAGTYGADEKYAASGAVISYLLMFITVPVLMMLI